MTLMNDLKREIRNQKCEVKDRAARRSTLNVSLKCRSVSCTFLLLATCILLLSSCRVYSFKDVSIPPEVKTVKIGFIENKARYVNPQLSPKLTDRLQQKIVNQTRLTRTNNDDAHYQISGYISDDFISTSGISNQTAATNRLTISVHITFLNTLANSTQEFDVSRNFDFSATLSRPQAEQALQDEVLRALTDEIFNHIFSNW
jgi:hypothetical protein